MAAIARRVVPNVQLRNLFAQCSRTFKTNLSRGNISSSPGIYLCGTAVVTSAYFGWKWMGKNAVVEAAKPTRRMTDEQSLRGLKLNHRERRFIKFSSAVYQGQLYMTPQDFIESVTDSEPRPRLKRRILFERDLDRFAQETPILSKGSPDMFRTIFDRGIISYTEYLFLLSILTKPQTGFRIAFNMFDTDGNERVDKEEFLVLMEMITAGVFRAYATWISDSSLDDCTDPKKKKTLQDTRQVVSEQLVGRSANNVRVGVI